jgi:hypothetical protein
MSEILQTMRETIKPALIRFDDFHTGKKNTYDIKWVHQNYIISKYDILVNNKFDNEFEGITLYDVAHPNSYIPKGKVVSGSFKYFCKKADFCISDDLKGMVISGKEKLLKQQLWAIRFMLRIWNLNSPHFWPDFDEKYIRYEGEAGRLPINYF